MSSSPLPWRVGGLNCRVCCEHGMNRADTECIAYLHPASPDKDRLWFECPSCGAHNYQQLSAVSWVAILGVHTALPVVNIPAEWDEPHAGETITEHDFWAFSHQMDLLPTAAGHSIGSTGRVDP